MTATDTIHTETYRDIPELSCAELHQWAARSFVKDRRICGSNEYRLTSGRIADTAEFVHLIKLPSEEARYMAE